MATSTEQINGLIEGYTDLKAYFEGARDDIDASVLAALQAIPDMQKAYRVSPTGDDTAAGTEAEPLASIREAVSRVPAGGAVSIYLEGGHTYEINTVDNNLSVSARFVRVASYGGSKATLMPRIIADPGSADRSTALGFTPNYNPVHFKFENLILDTGSFAAGRTMSYPSYGGFVTRAGGVGASGDIIIDLHDVDILMRDHQLWGAYTHCKISFITVDVQLVGTRTALNSGGSTFGLNVYSLSMPTGTTLTDLISGIQRDAGGRAINVLSNVEV